MSLVQAVDVIIMAFATKLSPLTEEMPDRAEEYSVPLEKGDARKGRGIYYPKFYSKNPSGGIARSSLSAWGLQTPLFALSCMCSVGILGVCCKSLLF